MRHLVNEPVLVLNKHFMAIQVTTAKESICALVTNKAKIVDEDYITYDLEGWIEFTKINSDKKDLYVGIIRSPSINLYVPQVIIILDCEFNNPAIKTVKYSRKNILQRDRNTCQYCGKKFNKNHLTLDHIIPKSRGGKSSWSNIVTACKWCNTKKGDKLLFELGWKTITVPQQPKWKSHIGIPFDKIKKEYWKKFLG